MFNYTFKKITQSNHHKTFHLTGFFVSYYCDEVGIQPCHCQPLQYKVVTPGGTIKCIACERKGTLSCEKDCQGRKHHCENEKPFPEHEAYICQEPGKNHFVKGGVIESCLEKCGRYEVSGGCYCTLNRACVCPKDTHYMDVANKCWKCSDCNDINSKKRVPDNQCKKFAKNKVFFLFDTSYVDVLGKIHLNY